MDNKEFKKEWIIERINETKDEKIINFLYGIIKGYIDSKEKKCI
nr:MAG: hypothetical protein [Bacteriophage sp.]